MTGLRPRTLVCPSWVSPDSLTKDDPERARAFRADLGLSADRVLLVASAGPHADLSACCLLDRRPAPRTGRWRPLDLLAATNRDRGEPRFWLAALSAGVSSGHSAMTFLPRADQTRLERDPRTMVVTLVYPRATARLLLETGDSAGFPQGGWSRATAAAMRRARLFESCFWPLGLPPDASSHEKIFHSRRLPADLALHEAMLDVLLPEKTDAD